MAQRPRLREVSQLTGVSLATVSRVLNGKPGVASETRGRVLQTLAEMGYRDVPKTPQSGVVGIITPEIDNPIFPLLAQTIEAKLARFGFLSMICPVTAETVNEQSYLDFFGGYRSAGVVVVNGRYTTGAVGYEPYRALRKRGIPTVLVNGVEADAGIPAVAADMRAGGAMAVRHLTSMGHKRVGCLVGPMKYVTTRWLLDGYRQGLAAAGMTAEDEYISESLFSTEGGRAGIANLLEAGVTGVITASDLMALGAISGVRAWGMSVPKDVSVVGYDGTSLVNYTSPTLTSIRQPIERMANTVATLLRNPPDNGGQVHLFHPDLVIGGSTGRAPS